MPLNDPGFGNRELPNIYGDVGGRGIGNTNPGLTPRPPTPRHPEGSFIPQGRGIVDLIWESIFGRGQINVPLGQDIDRRDLPIATRPSFPPLRSVPRIIRSEARPVTIVGGASTQNQRRLPVVGPVRFPTTEVRSSPDLTEGSGLPPETNGGNVADITHFLRDLLPGGSDIFDVGANVLSIFGGSPTAGGGRPPDLPTANVPAVQSGGGMLPPPGGGGIAVGCERDPSLNYILKYTCGEWKWVKKRKRRRKRLATSSDIKDLSSLKGVLGGGKSFDLWIATHAN